MKKASNKLSVRLSEEDVEIIEKYPGENISAKVRSLLTMHNLLTGGINGDDLAEKYEILLNDYIREFSPAIGLEIEQRRKELKKYVKIIKNLNDLQEATFKLCQDIKDLSSRSTTYVERLVADCVVVRKNEDEIIKKR